MVDFPLDSDVTYEFTPRPMVQRPPEGPVTEGEFRAHFYGASSRNYPWHRHQQQEILFNPSNKSALQSLPKKIQTVEIEDGERETFWGIYARERREFIWVFAYICLCNLPGVLFFFLWLFPWGHISDIQNAAVPIQLSLSLSICFVALLYESRERNFR